MKKNKKYGSKNNNAAVQNAKAAPADATVSNQPEAEVLPESQAAGFEVTEDMLIQFGENEVSVKRISDKVRQSCEENYSGTQVKEVKIYVKPEDNKAYYVLNGELEGSVELA